MLGPIIFSENRYKYNGSFSCIYGPGFYIGHKLFVALIFDYKGSDKFKTCNIFSEYYVINYILHFNRKLNSII